MCRFYGSYTSESWLTSYQIFAYLIRRSGGRCHCLYVLGLLSGIIQSKSCTSLGYSRRYLHCALMSRRYIEWMHVDEFKEIGRRIILHTFPYGIREQVGSSLHPLWWVLWTFHYPNMQWYHRITRSFMTPPLHRDDMRFHTTTGTTQILVSYSPMFLKCFLDFNQKIMYL